MKMSMLRRQSKLSAIGNKIYVGCEARPYSDKNLLIVTNQAVENKLIKNTSLISKIGGVDNFCNLLAKIAFEEQLQPEFCEYLRENFSDLCLEAQEIDDSCVIEVNYYACRFTAIFCAYFIKYVKEFSAENLFKQLEITEDLDQKSAIIEQYAVKLSKKVQEKCSCVKESLEINGEKLFTKEDKLCAQVGIIIANEKSKATDLVYLNSGNACGFVWNQEGFMQIARFDTSGSEEFELKGRYISNFVHPFIAFCASEGCYNCSVFASPLDFEYLLLETIKKNVDLEKSSMGLQEIFSTIAINSQSSSMAVLCQGFSDNVSLKNWVANRHDYIQNNIISILPGIFEKDYLLEGEDAENRLIQALSSCISVLSDNKIRARVIEEMLDKEYQPLVFEIERYIKSNSVLNSDYYLMQGEKIGQTIKRFYNLKKEEVLKQKKLACAKLLSLINLNWQSGVNFSSLNVVEEPFFNGEEFHYEDREKENKIKVYLLIKNTKKMIFDGERFIYREQILQVPEDIQAEFSNCLNMIFGEKHRIAFAEYLQLTANSYAKDFYLKECKFMAKEIYQEYGERVVDFNDFKVNRCLNALKQAKNNHELRLKIYAEYDSNYKKLIQQNN